MLSISVSNFTSPNFFFPKASSISSIRELVAVAFHSYITQEKKIPRLNAGGNIDFE